MERLTTDEALYAELVENIRRMKGYEFRAACAAIAKDRHRDLQGGAGDRGHPVVRVQHGPEVAVERRATAGFTLAASIWLQWLRTFSTYTPGPGSFAGSSYTALDLARETRRVLPYFELTAEWRVGRPR